MGRSSPSCFKIIACGGDSANHDLQPPPESSESKASSDRRGWSFRKRSARHRVLSSTVLEEVTLRTNKGSPESPAAETQAENDLPVEIDSSLTVLRSGREDDCMADATIDVSCIVLIQTAIRKYLVQQVLLKQMSVRKLQAAVRGHLVRRHAVGTLRCVQAIVKIQVLVRKRRAHLLEEGSGTSLTQNANSGKAPLVRSIGNAKPNITCTSIEKLLSNKFARQLMESTLMTQPINIKCDPLKSDSTWKWLERWMSVSSVINEGPQESGSAREQHEKAVCGHSKGKGNVLVLSGGPSEANGFKSGMGPLSETFENDDMITLDADKFDLHAFSSVAPVPSPPNLQNMDESNSTFGVSKPAPAETEETILIPKVETGSLPSNFKELSPSATSAKLNTSPSDSPGFELCFGKVSVSTNSPMRFREIGLVETSVSSDPAFQIDRSECGTELSITSTLDSPDRSEGGADDPAREPKTSGASEHPGSRHNLGLGPENSQLLGTELSYPNITQLESYEIVSGTSDEHFYSPLLDKKLESNPSNLQGKLETEATDLAHKPSPEASSVSRKTVNIFEATSSGQISVHPKKSQGERSESKQKNRSPSIDKRFVSTAQNHDSTSKSILQQPSKEHETGKPRISFSSAKPDHPDQEPRDSCSSNPLPSYMQATESAKAKAILNGSPRSSPAEQEKDVHIKSRVSGSRKSVQPDSPRIVRSLSQALQRAKGPGILSPQERKWRL